MTHSHEYDIDYSIHDSGWDFPPSESPAARSFPPGNSSLFLWALNTTLSSECQADPKLITAAADNTAWMSEDGLVIINQWWSLSEMIMECWHLLYHNNFHSTSRPGRGQGDVWWLTERFVPGTRCSQTPPSSWDQPRLLSALSAAGNSEYYNFTAGNPSAKKFIQI